MGVFDVPATDLIEEIAKDLEQKFKLEKPAFTEFVKTGMQAERAPQREDWYYVRCASILYRIYKEGALGVGSLRTYYGGKKNRGVKPHRFRKASGKVIRKAMQDLEGLELIKKAGKGRVISAKGQSYLVKKSVEVSSVVKERKTVFIKKKAEDKAKQDQTRAETLKKKEVLSQKQQQKGKRKQKEEKKE